MSYCAGKREDVGPLRCCRSLEGRMEVFWIVVIGFLIVGFVFKLITSPMRSADTLKRIERDLKRRG